MDLETYMQVVFYRAYKKAYAEGSRVLVFCIWNRKGSTKEERREKSFTAIYLPEEFDTTNYRVSYAIAVSQQMHEMFAKSAKRTETRIQPYICSGDEMLRSYEKQVELMKEFKSTD